MERTRESSRACAICRRPAWRQSKLCRDCTSALKRARLESAVSQFMPLPLLLSVAGDARLGRPRRQHRSRHHAATAAPTVRTVPSARSAAMVAVLALLAAGVVISPFAIQDLNLAGSGNSVSSPAGASHSADAPVPPWATGDGAATPAPVQAPDPPASASAEAMPVPVRAEPMNALPRAVPAAVIRRTVAPSAPVSPPRSNVGMSRPTIAAAETSQGADLPAAASLPAPQASPAPDRWQAMREAIAQCSREGVLAAFLCGERVRLQYCDGHWGAAPQCPSANRNEYGN